MNKIDPRSKEALLKKVSAVERAENAKKFRAIDFYKPYPKQAEFHMLGSYKRERLFMAANQVGKTFCGGCEIAYHLTGNYPDWWLGKQWDRPTRGWVAGITGESTRDNPQRILCGTKAGGFGTGAIPKDAVNWDKDVTTARGVSDFLDTVVVKHKSGERSEMKFKSYERGREKWQGDTLDWIWFDEEPDMDVYSEGLTRLREGGMVFITFTPLLGWSKVVDRYLKENRPDCGVVKMGLREAQHFSDEEKVKRLAGYEAHERQARSEGEPLLGSGAIFTEPEANLKVDPKMLRDLPQHWAYIWGIDFGINHPFAAVLLGWDRDADVITICHAYRATDKAPIDHAAALKPYGVIPVAWPQDGTGRESSGETLAHQYKKHGVQMLPEHATFPDGGLSTEAGVSQLDERMRTGKLKVMSHLHDWFEEYRMYHRKDGLIVKVKDDLLSATRVGMMMRRKAKPLGYLTWRQVAGDTGGQKVKIAAGVDPDSHWGI